MFKLTRSELDCAKEAIQHHGYSTLMPEPPEWHDVVQNWRTFRDYLSNLDLERYTPQQPLAITVAKNESSVRIVHLLHPEDLLLYTALALILKNDIEGIRLPKAKGRVYSYRASREKSKLYRSVQRTHKRYTECLKAKAKNLRTKAVVVTDVTDFYASISHIQLGRLLSEAVQTQRSEDAARLLVSVFAVGFMEGERRGIPTGPLASRLLAEVVLNDVDNALADKRIDFVRWVDDYNIFARSVSSAKNIVLDLAGWLYKNHGLTLQSAKTHVFTREEYARKILADVEDLLSNRSAILELLQDYDEADQDIDELIDDVHAVELLEMLVEAITKEDGIDDRIIKFAVRKLRRIFLDRRAARSVLEVIAENVDRLSPVIAVIAPLVVLLLAEVRMSKRVGRLLLGSLERSCVDHRAVWVLTIFAERPRAAFLDSLIAVYEATTSDVVKRYAALAIGKSGGSVAIDIEDWERMPPLIRLMLLKYGSLDDAGMLRLDGMLEEVIAESRVRPGSGAHTDEPLP